MSGSTMIQSRYTCAVATTATTTRRSKTTTPSNRKTRSSIVIKPTSVVTKELSRLLYPIESADEAYSIITTCLDEKNSLLHGPSDFDDHNECVNKTISQSHHPFSSHRQEQQQQQQQPQTALKPTIRDIFDHELNQVEQLRQPKLNRKCTGWKYADTKNCITAMANVVEVAVHTHIQQQQQQQQQRRRRQQQANVEVLQLSRCRQKAVASTTASTSATATISSSRSTTPCRNIPTETLLLSAPTNSFDEDINSSLSPSIGVHPCATNIHTDSENVHVQPTACTEIFSPLIQNVVESDTEDSKQHSLSATLLPRSVAAAPTTVTVSPTTRFMNYPSVLEHATATNIVSDDSEVDAAPTTKNVTKYDGRTTTSMTVTSKKYSSSENDSHGTTIPIHVTISSLPTITQDDKQLQNFWSQLLEYIQFHVSISTVQKQEKSMVDNVTTGASRTNATTRKSSIYEMYQMSEPIYVQDATSSRTHLHENIKNIQEKVYSEFTSLYCGLTNNTNRRSEQQESKDDDENSIRINTFVVNTNEVWIQININASYDFNWETANSQNQLTKPRNRIAVVKKNKTHMDFIVVIPTCNNEPQQYVAISANRMKSKTKYISYILSAIENVFNCSQHIVHGSPDCSSPAEDEASDDPVPTRKLFTATHGQAKKPQYDKCLSGLDPYELFRSVHARTASTCDQLKSTLSDTVAGTGGNTIAGLYAAGTGCLYSDNIHDDRTIRSRKRRMRDDNDDVITKNGKESKSLKPLPDRTSVRWDWNGMTNASASSWGPSVPDQEETSANIVPVVNYPFKCRLTMSGTNVVSGMQALMDHGFMKKTDTSSTIPHYVRAVMSESPSNLLFGDNNKDVNIRVENGDIILRRN